LILRITPEVDFWDKPLVQLLTKLNATPTGLTDSEAKRRLREYGPNSMARESRFADLFKFMRLFAGIHSAAAIIVGGDRVAVCHLPLAGSSG
jgi:hypothetical protein